jgi:hypothetical protein
MEDGTAGYLRKRHFEAALELLTEKYFQSCKCD